VEKTIHAYTVTGNQKERPSGGPEVRLENNIKMVLNYCMRV
jgi:hypothetical protein